MKKNELVLCLIIVILSLGSSLSTGQSNLGRGPHRGRVPATGKSSVLQPARQPAKFGKTSLSAIPLGVRRRVPQDYATIQGAINASADGDTVLVSEGTYIENSHRCSILMVSVLSHMWRYCSMFSHRGDAIVCFLQA